MSKPIILRRSAKNAHPQSGMDRAAIASNHDLVPFSRPAPIYTRHDHRLSSKRRKPYSGAADPSLFPIAIDQTRNQDASVSQTTSKAKKKRGKRVHTPPGDRATNTNSCFVCFQSGGHDYAVQIHFVWPGRWVYRKGLDEIDDLTMIWPFFQFEGSEVEVMQAIQDAIYKEKGRWKRWLWCYEIRSAEEVKVWSSHCL
jgi:hypothetical protein